MRATMTITELNTIKEELVESMKSVFKKDKSLEPMAIMIGQDGKIGFMPMPFRDHQEKQNMINGLKAVCRNLNPAAVVIIHEAWILVVDKNDKEGIKKVEDLAKSGKSVKDLDGRKESVVVMFETFLGHEMITYDIDSNKKLINELRTKEVKGIFCNLLTPVNQN